MNRKIVWKIDLKQYNLLSNQVKKEIINAVESGEKKEDVAAEYKISRSTLSTFLWQEDEIWNCSIDN